MCKNPGSTTWQSEELHQAWKVYRAYSKVKLNTLSLSDPSAMQNGADFLIELELFAELLKLRPATRDYRKNFTRNYQFLFKDFGRQYRFDLLEAMVQECQAIDVNGNQFAFSTQVVELSRETLSLLRQLGQHLLWCTSRCGTRACEKQSKHVLADLLDSFDSAWASFECQYIQELIHVEAEARSPLTAAVTHAKDIPAKEEDVGYDLWCVSLQHCRHQQKILFGRIAELNVMANSSRKGRGDLDEDVLRIAVDILSCPEIENCSLLVRSVCQDLVESFSAMCRYLCSLDGCMESVDPILINNEVLVERLADLEEAWEMAARYVGDASVRSTLDVVCATLDRIQELEPSFQRMCSDYDVGLFLIIPRVAWLVFLADRRKDALMKTLLPHIFEEQAAKNSLQTLHEQFEALVSENPVFADIFTRQVVHGPGTEERIALIPEERRGMMSSFMRELERWSIELQRRHASDWNAFCSVIVRHLSSVGANQQ